MLEMADNRADTPAQVAKHPVDEQAMPIWGTGPDGRFVKITSDERIHGLFAGWLADACAHPRCVVARWVNKGGALVHKRYCYDCGATISQFLKKEDAEREGITDISRARIDAISAAYEAARNGELKRIADAAAERQQAPNRADYDDYLRSPEWRRKAAAIIKRAGGICEGCLGRPATQVHHLTYQNRYNEFAWELRAVCDHCHDRAHSLDAA